MLSRSEKIGQRERILSKLLTNGADEPLVLALGGLDNPQGAVNSPAIEINHCILF